ncbi:MAG: signal peptidase I [Jatrophihabitans sp.]|uniref:signal peptidase I n=1 Tax=Jatrophihabitans sp. TaxID=1932789 RepID=UPI003F7EA343
MSSDAAGTAGRRHGRGRTRLVLWVTSGVLATLVLLLIVPVLFFSDVVVGPSMEPLLRPGDRVVLNPLSYRFGDPARGDVVALDPPSGPRGTAVKRIIALPGDQLEILPGARAVLRLRLGGVGPWQRRVEPYVRAFSSPSLGCCDASGRATLHPAPYTVPRGHYFVMGDNRNVSVDSRAYGPVPAAAIDGRVVWRVLPLGRFGSI